MKNGYTYGKMILKLAATKPRREDLISWAARQVT